MILTISKDHYITVLDSLEEAERQPESEYFTSLEELTAIAADWPASRLVEIWNNLPGVMPVKKFTDRKTAVTRIWKTLQAINESASVPTQEMEPVETEPAATGGGTPVEPAETTESQEPTSTPQPEQEAIVAPQTADFAPVGQGWLMTPARNPRERARTAREAKGRSFRADRRPGANRNNPIGECHSHVPTSRCNSHRAPSE
jgi:hypothetical protein